MTTHQTLQSQPTAGKKAVYLNRFQEITRASWFESATGPGAAEKGEHGRNGPVIDVNANAQEFEH
jgi:hypothetical protein